MPIARGHHIGRGPGDRKWSTQSFLRGEKPQLPNSRSTTLCRPVLGQPDQALADPPLAWTWPRTANWLRSRWAGDIRWYNPWFRIGGIDEPRRPEVMRRALGTRHRRRARDHSAARTRGRGFFSQLAQSSGFAAAGIAPPPPRSRSQLARSRDAAARSATSSSGGPSAAIRNCSRFGNVRANSAESDDRGVTSSGRLQLVA